MEKISIKTQSLIGEKAFKLLLENDLNKEVLIPLAVEYGVSTFYVFECSEKYRKGTLNPKATEAELIKYRKLKHPETYARKKDEVDLWIDDLLKKNDTELHDYALSLKNTTLLQNKIRKYCIYHEDELEKVSALLLIRNKIEKYRREYFDGKREEKKSQLQNENNKTIKIKQVIDEYISKEYHYFPNLIWEKHTKNSYSLFIDELEELKTGTNEDRKYYEKATIVLEARTKKFKQDINDFCNYYSNGITYNGDNYIFDSLDFYQRFHLSIHEFKSFCSLAFSNGTITNVQYDAVTRFYNMYEKGENNLITEDILKRKITYNNKEVSKELKETIVISLVSYRIPVTQNNLVSALKQHYEGRLKDTIQLNSPLISNINAKNKEDRDYPRINTYLLMNESELREIYSDPQKFSNLKISIGNFLKNNPEDSIITRRLKSILECFDVFVKENRENKKVKNADARTEFMYECIDDYVNACDDVLIIDTLIEQKGNNPALFYKYLDYIKEGTEEEQRYYKLFIDTYYTRASCIIEIINSVVETYLSRKQTPEGYNLLDYYMQTSIELKDLKKYAYRLNKPVKYQPQKLMDNWKVSIIDKLCSSYGIGNHELSEEEIDQFKLSVNNRELTEEEKVRIVDYLKENRVPITNHSLNGAATKYLKGYLNISKIYE